jgi:Flp pilus assembly protein TadG
MIRNGTVAPRRHRDERAASALEMSIVAPVFILIIFAIVEAGFLWYGRNVALLSAREGASYLRVSGTFGETSGWETQAERTAVTYANEVGFLDDVTADATITGLGETEARVTVEVSGQVTELVPFWDPTITRSVTAELEQFEPDTGESR